MRAELVRVHQQQLAIDDVDARLLAPSAAAVAQAPIWRSAHEPLLQDDAEAGAAAGAWGGGSGGVRGGRQFSIINVEGSQGAGIDAGGQRVGGLWGPEGGSSPGKGVSRGEVGGGGRYALSQSWFKQKLLAESSEGSDDESFQVEIICVGLGVAF